MTGRDDRHGRSPSVGAGLLLALAVAGLATAGGSRTALRGSAAPSPVPFAATLRFDENRGQGPQGTAFLLEMGAAVWGLSADRLDWQGTTWSGEARLPNGGAVRPGRASVLLRGADPRALLVGEGRTGERAHYLVGADSRRWVRDVSRYDRVRCRQAYPGIDVVYYLNRGQLEFDFCVAPGSDPSRIELDLAGAGPAVPGVGGTLELPTTAGRLHWERPAAYQLVAGVRRPVEVEYAIEPVAADRTRVRLALGSYDTRAELVIDPKVVVPPLLSHSHLLGGNSQDFYTGVTAVNDGVVVVGSSLRTPPVGAPNFDIVIYDFSPTGELRRRVVLGGPGGDFVEKAQGLPGGPFVLVGGASDGFPTTPNAHQPTYGGGPLDGFLTVVNPNSVMPTLDYSTFLGGAGTDQLFGVSVTTTTLTENPVAGVGVTDSPDLRTTPGVVQPGHGGGLDGLLLTGNYGNDTLNGASVSYLGGAANDILFSGFRNPAGNVVVGGSAHSPTVPGLPAGRDPNGDGLLAELTPGLERVLRGKRVGGTAADGINVLTFDPSANRIYMGGFTGTDNWIPGAPRLRRGGMTVNGFVAFTDPLFTTLTGTYLGGSGADTVRDLKLYPTPPVGAPAGTTVGLVVVGNTRSTDWPVRDDLGRRHGGENDGFVTVVDPKTFAQKFFTVLGGAGNDVLHGTLPVGGGSFLAVGSAGSANFPRVGDPLDTPTDAQNGFLAQVVPPFQFDITGTLNFGRVANGQRVTRQLRFKNTGLAGGMLRFPPVVGGLEVSQREVRLRAGETVPVDFILVGSGNPRPTRQDFTARLDSFFAYPSFMGSLPVR